MSRRMTQLTPAFVPMTPASDLFPAQPQKFPGIFEKDGLNPAQLKRDQAARLRFHGSSILKCGKSLPPHPLESSRRDCPSSPEISSSFG